MAVNKDPFEEFEFRPINEGLGFHRKQKSQFTVSNVTPNEATRAAKPSPAFISNTPKATASNTFETPLPRNPTRNDSRPETISRKSFNVPTIEDDSIAKAQTAVNEILKNLNQKRQLDFIHETEKQKVELKKSRPFLFAATLDAMLISAVFLMSMIVMLTITKVDLFMNLGHAETSRFVYIATAGLFLTITFIYMVVNRAFAGCTPGEWAFDQSCGYEKQMNSLTYIPRLALRTLVVMATGFIVLPLLSYLFNKDMAGQITGVNLLRKPNV